MRRRPAVLTTFLLFAAACGGGNGGETTTRVTVPATTIQAATTLPTAAPSPAAGTAAPKVPEARSVGVAQFLRPGTSKVAVVYGDMNGVAPEEIVVHSRSDQPGPNGLAANEYVDAYSWAPGPKKWQQVFDATTYTGQGGAGKILEPDGGVNQSVFGPFAMVDFAGDGTPELLFAVQSSGAGPGPYAVWILSWLSEAFSTDFTFATERGGTLKLNPDKSLTLKSGEYGPNDPGCCPSNNAVRTIGYDMAEKKIKVLKTELTPNPAP